MARIGGAELDAAGNGVPAWTAANHQVGDDTRAAIKGVAANTTRAYTRQ